MTASRHLTKRLSVLLLATLAAVLLTVVLTWLQSERREAAANEQLLRLRSRISLGQAEDRLIREFSSDEYDLLTCSEREGELGIITEYVCTTPLQLTAGNWVLRIGIKGGRVVYLRIRTMDVVGHDEMPPPEGAPGDLTL
jgi:hypothetical protein